MSCPSVRGDNFHTGNGKKPIFSVFSNTGLHLTSSAFCLKEFMHVSKE